MEILNWLGLFAFVFASACFGLIAFKRSAWWGPAKSSIEVLDQTEKKFALIGMISFLISVISFGVANF
jgi:hypothetical protein